MSETELDSLRFPQEFLQEADELACRTDEGDAWAKFMYGDWFVCRMSNLAEEVEIRLMPRWFYDRTDDEEANKTLDVVCDNQVIDDACTTYGHRRIRVSIEELILGVGQWLEHDNPDEILEIADRIESEVANAIRRLRERVTSERESA
jgi:hypothetical protein